MPIVPLPDLDDPRLAPFTRLRDEQLRRRREAPGGDLAGICVAEGPLVVERAVAAGLRCRAVLADADALHRVPAVLLETVPVYAAPAEAVSRLAGYEVHRGPLAAFDRPQPAPADEVLARGPARVVVLEGVNDATNLGAIVRSAVGLGAGALLLDPTCCDPFFRRVLRTSMGAVLDLPFARLPALGRGGLEALHDHGYRTVALTPAPDAEPLDQAASALAAAPRVALLLGAEGPGLRAATLAGATDRVAIPMAGGIDSVNVTVAASIALWALRPVAGDRRGDAAP